MDQPRNSIVLLADGLRPSVLGPYGNTWFDTTRINQLASQSLVFEQCISDSPDVQLGLRGILKGIHACDKRATEYNLLNGLVQSGVGATLVTGRVEKFSDFQNDFSEIYEVECPAPTKLANDISQTYLAGFFAAATDAIKAMNGPGSLILDCDGLTQAWDAPYLYREQLADPDDPEPSSRAEVPAMEFVEAVDDPDQLLDFQIAYGSQIRLFDELLEIALQEIDQSKWGREALFCLTATRGFPLGEHGVVGFYRPTLYNECAQVPMLIRWPGALRRSGRSGQLIQPGSVFDFLADWHALKVPYRSPFPKIDPDVLMANKREMAVVGRSEVEDVIQYSLQTASWKYLSGTSRQLFVKPDDIWEFNDVSDLCSQVANDLELQLTSAIEHLTEGRIQDFELSDALAFGVE